MLVNKKAILFATIVVGLGAMLAVVAIPQLESETRAATPVVIQRPVASRDMHLSQEMKELGSRLDRFIEKYTQEQSQDNTTTAQKLADLSQVLDTIHNVFEQQKTYFEKMEATLQHNQEAILSSIDQQVTEDKNALRPEDLLIFDQPPFRLLAVEYWEGSPTAILALDDKTKSVQLGDYVAKWKVLKIDVLNRAIDVAHQSDLYKTTRLEVGA